MDHGETICIVPRVIMDGPCKSFVKKKSFKSYHQKIHGLAHEKLRKVTLNAKKKVAWIMVKL